MTSFVSKLTLPRAVLFDNDGVLIQSEPLHWGAWIEFLKTLDISVPEGFIESQAGKTGPEILKSALKQFKPDLNPTSEQITQWVLEKNNYYQMALKNSLRAYPGAKELLTWLEDQGIFTAVVSNARSRELHASLNHVGLSHFFKVKISRDDVVRAKPDPLPYLTACALLGVEPYQTWVIEDSPIGLEAALRAGATGIGVLTNFKQEELITPVLGRPDLKTHLIVESLIELQKLIKTL